MLRTFLALVSLLPLAAPGRAADPDWLEGESATRSAAFTAGGWGRTQDLSGGQWLFAAIDAADVAAKVPDGGLTATLKFTVPAAGKQQVHARIGYEFARSPFRWRIDAGGWHDVTPDSLTTDLMAIADSAEVAWLKLSDVEFTAGPHAIEFNVPRPKPGERLLFALDCVHVTPAAFRPNGPYKPGALWKYALDYTAEKVRFDFPAVPPRTPQETRQTLSLAGTWRTARYDEQVIDDRTGPIKELPADLDALAWRGIPVPGDRDAALPGWAYAHRFLYRAAVRVPADLAGRRMLLRFPNNSLLTTVWVNGRRVGFSDTPCAEFVCDATAAIRFGESNDVVVGIKDNYYAVSKTPDGRSPRTLFNLPHARFDTPGCLGVTRFADFPTLGKVRRTGILEAPSLVAVGPVFSADVFAQPSVAQKQLTVTTTVENPGNTAATLELRHDIFLVGGERGAPPERTFKTHTVTVPAGGREVVTLTEGWRDPKLWWPDDPRLYTIETTVTRDGKPLDRAETTFGFREWGTRGNQFTLNGLPWHGRADRRHAGRKTRAGAEAAVREWRANGQTMTLYRGDEPWVGESQADTLDFFDRAGVPVRRGGLFDGGTAPYQLVTDGEVHASLFDNWRKQLAAQVKAERNHPSVMTWSLDGGEGGWPPQVGPEITKAAALVQQLDPTRPVVAVSRRPVGPARDYPPAAYNPPRGGAGGGPLFLSQSLPAAPAEIIGESAYLGRAAASAGTTRLARMLSEGYRTGGVAAFEFAFAAGPDAEYHKAWQPNAVLTREWDTAWPAGTKFARTLTVFNDTRDPSPLTVFWVLQTRGAKSVELRGQKSVAVPPGGQLAVPVSLDLPAVPPGATVEADWAVIARRGDVELFRDVKLVRILGPVAAPAEPPAAVVFDPANKLPPEITRLVDGKAVATLDAVPAGTRLLLVGPDAVTAESAASPRWVALAAAGTRVVVYDQTHPLRDGALPAAAEPTDFAGHVAFPENPSHPAFAGLTAADFFGGRGDGTVYRNAYRKPTNGGRSHLQCDADLGCTALLELAVGDGLLLLNQTPLGVTPDSPALLRFAANLVRYADAYERGARPTAVLLPDGDPRLKLLAATGVKFTRTADPVAALETAEIVVADATPELLAKLAAAPEKLAAFQTAGRQLVLWGVTPAGLKEFNKLVGYEHVLRLFRTERVVLPERRDPLVAGLNLRDVMLVSGDGDPAGDVFTHVVDLDDAAPFATSAGYPDGWAKMTNGLTSADSLKSAFRHDQAAAGLAPSWAAKLARQEVVTGVSLVVNTEARVLTGLRVVFDGRTDTAMTLTLRADAGRLQSFTFPPRRCTTVALEPLTWTAGPRPVVGIDLLTITVRRPADFRERVVPLLNIGALVSYPKAGIVLNQLRVDAMEANPANAAKKRKIVAAILENLGAEFAPAKPSSRARGTPTPAVADPPNP